MTERNFDKNKHHQNNLLYGAYNITKPASWNKYDNTYMQDMHSSNM